MNDDINYVKNLFENNELDKFVELVNIDKITDTETRAIVFSFIYSYHSLRQKLSDNNLEPQVNT